MISRSGFYKAFLVIALGLYFCKNVVFSFVSLTSMSNNKFDKLTGQEKITLAFSMASIFALTKSIYIFKYNKENLLRILKIFLKINS